MKITIEYDTENATDKVFFDRAIAFIEGNFDGLNKSMYGASNVAIPTETDAAPTPPFIKKEVEAETAKKRAKKDVAAPPPAAAVEAPKPAAAPVAKTGPTLNDDKPKLETARTRLGEYSADKRFGMPGVLKKLADHKVARISDLPVVSYDDFMKELDDALAAPPAVDPLA